MIRVECLVSHWQFHAQQLDKQKKAAQDAQAVKEFRQLQIAETKARKEDEAKEDVSYNLRNRKLLQVIIMMWSSEYALNNSHYYRLKRPNSRSMQVQSCKVLQRERLPCSPS